MKRWALVSGDAAFLVIEQADAPDGLAEWREVGAGVQLGHRLVNGEWLKPGLSSSDVRARCERELTESDKRATRALEESGEVPATLKLYREALRQIYRAGTPPEDWPRAPEYQPRG